ncbi:hypothetical protein CAC42_4446 [Sphaceloma murrayae]|uniref:AA9 family lytic polysaccharide monooxygenase n=1 Tax=Sphaceloma murrayae TaxID=2082308 RepID=A0A2K1QLK8_9PEZI|nr:hypothetical protein CAC42_4446 [Sphaceloma murrayae]
MKSFLTALPLLAATASAHTTFQALWVDGKQGGLKEASSIRHSWTDPESNYPLKDTSVPEIACNKWATKPAAQKLTIKAGSQVTAEWHHEPTVRAGDTEEPIALSHKGPILAYLGKVDDSATASPNGVKWFKIYEDGLDSAGKWGVERFYENKGMIPFTIPSCVADGDYFLRVEVIGLHEADRANGAQLYPECAQISITGGGTASPETVSFPGAYTNNGVGLSYNLYSGQKAAYTPPGPRPFTCGAGSSPAPAPSSSAPASSSTAAPAPSAPSTSSAAPAPSAPSSSSAPAPAPSAPSSSSAQAPAPTETVLTTFTTMTATTRRTRTRTAPASYPTTSRQAIPSSSSAPAPAPQPSTPSGPSAPTAPTRQEIESFFTQIMSLYNTWKAQVGA